MLFQMSFRIVAPYVPSAALAAEAPAAEQRHVHLVDDLDEDVVWPRSS
jgi:hypothetical protein